MLLNSTANPFDLRNLEKKSPTWNIYDITSKGILFILGEGIMSLNNILFWSLKNQAHLSWLHANMGFRGGSDGKESACNAGDLGSISGLGRSPGGEQGNLL